MKQLQFRHNCQNLGCADVRCAQCKLSQKRRCDGNFATKYLAPCDVIEAKCGAQIYVVVVDAFTGELMIQGLDDAFLELAIIDGRKFEQEGSREETLDSCKLLVNKQGHALLAHGRSGSYSDDKHIVVPMIHGQSMLPDLKVTESSEALLTGRAPPFRLMARAIWRTGERIVGIAPVLSEPFVVATARVKGAAKVEIPHVEDHVSKLEGLGLQTQKKLEDIAAAATAAGVPTLNVPLNCVTKVGQFRELVELAEQNKPLRETLKQVLRLTKGWDLAREHALRAVGSDKQLRVFHPDGRTDVGLVFKCGTYNVVDVQHPIGLLRRRQNPNLPNQDLVDVIWLPQEAIGWPDAVRRLVPRAAAAWWNEGHPGWAFLPLSLDHVPAYGEDGNPGNSMSSFTFTRPATADQRSGNGHQQQPQPGFDAPQMPSSVSGITGSRIVAPPPHAPIMSFAAGSNGLLLPNSMPLPPQFPTGNAATMFGSGGLPGALGIPPSNGQNTMMGTVPTTNQASSEDAAFQNMMQFMTGGGSGGTGEGSGGPEPAELDYSTGKLKRKAGSPMDAREYETGASPQDNHRTEQQSVPCAPDSAPAQLNGVTMGDLRRMFGRAAKQEIPYESLESFLRQHHLLPLDDAAEGHQQNESTAGPNQRVPFAQQNGSADDLSMDIGEDGA